ncbi:MAG TPA: outer membrane beta-barrel protein [Vicinamibacterales bacterium]|nr:outer membrane beta-barrel protein [Vicinamibacterales bacterium]
MTSPLRLLGMAAALNVSLGVGTAAAQRVMVRHLPVGTSVEVVLNGAAAGTGTVDQSGDVTIPFTLPEKDGKAEMDANIFVDTCEKIRRVVIAEVSRPAPPAAEGCDRREISGLFWVRRVNTIVIDAAPANPTLLLISGNYTPPPDPVPGEESSGASIPHAPLPRGFVMFAGAGLTSYRDVLPLNCGNLQTCSGDGSPYAYTFGATYWITRYLGVEGSFLHPQKVKISGGDGFTFDTSMNVDIWNLVAKAGVQAGPVRLYGQGGMSYHQATHVTSQTLGDVSQRFELQTEGWSYVYGGGAEIWVKPRVALFGQLDFARLKGKATDDSEFNIDDRARSLIAGIRVHIGG